MGRGSLVLAVTDRKIIANRFLNWNTRIAEFDRNILMLNLHSSSNPTNAYW